MKTSSIIKSLGTAAFLSAFISCSRTDWNDEELSLIPENPQVMRVLTLDGRRDSLQLRQASKNITPQDIRSSTYRTLTESMLLTVTDPSQDGVGIAGPQVGILRRIVAVQRLDKEGEPFEVYPNIRITSMRGEMVNGREGCLSVPEGYVNGSNGSYGTVPRSRDIDISYTSPKTLKDTSESISGFTAVIFQHEIDHLDGVLFIDKTINNQ